MAGAMLPPLQLMTMPDNIKFSKAQGSGSGPAIAVTTTLNSIEVPFVDAIPSATTD